MEARQHTALFRGDFILLGLLAACLTAIYKAMDNITVHNFIVADDRWIAAFSFLVIGGWTGTIFSVAYALLVGRRLVDPDFKGIVLANKTMHINAFLAGSVSAVSTLFTLLATQFIDPGGLSALASATIVYTTLYDVRSKQVVFRHFWPLMLATMVGSALAAYSGSFVLSLAGILFILIISNGLSAISSIFEQKGTRASDGASYFIWRFFWLATCGTILAVITSTIRGQSEQLVQTIQTGLNFIPFVAASMFLVFVSSGIRFTLKKKNAITIVGMLGSAQIILSFPITIIGNWIHPEIFGTVPESVGIWVIRIMGVLLLIWSIRQLRRNKAKLTGEAV